MSTRVDVGNMDEAAYSALALIADTVGMPDEQVEDGRAGCMVIVWSGGAWHAAAYHTPPARTVRYMLRSFLDTIPIERGMPQGAEQQEKALPFQDVLDQALSNSRSQEPPQIPDASKWALDALASLRDRSCR